MESLDKGIGNNSAYTHAAANTASGVDTYVFIADGVKVNRNDGCIHFVGLAESKTVIEPGEYKVVKSKPETLARREIEKQLPSARFRQFAVGNVARIAANGDVIEVEQAA
jgi:hypothetical protein